jgi:hypothetical protein
VRVLVEVQRDFMSVLLKFAEDAVAGLDEPARERCLGL